MKAKQQIYLATIIIVLSLLGCKEKPKTEISGYGVYYIDWPDAAFDEGVVWPDVFIEVDYEYPEHNKKEMAVADGLMGWALSMWGYKPPENFGQGLVKIGKIIGEAATPENLKRLADEILKIEGAELYLRRKI